MLKRMTLSIPIYLDITFSINCHSAILGSVDEKLTEKQNFGPKELSTKVNFSFCLENEKWTFRSEIIEMF